MKQIGKIVVNKMHKIQLLGHISARSAKLWVSAIFCLYSVFHATVVNRYQNVSKFVYNDLYSLVHDKDYFVWTINVGHCYLKAGFDKHRLFYTQGDYGL